MVLPRLTIQQLKFIAPFVLGIAIIVGSVMLFRNPEEQTSSEITPENFPSAEELALADNDRDGLTNNEELIFNTDPNNPDTDNDGVSDEQETINGSDPTKAGEAPISENEILKENLTVSFFAWEKTKNETASSSLTSINKSAVDAFLTETEQITPTIPPLSAKDAGVTVAAEAPTNSQMNEHLLARYYSFRIPEAIIQYIYGIDDLLATEPIEFLTEKTKELNKEHNVQSILESVNNSYFSLKTVVSYGNLAHSQLEDISTLRVFIDILQRIYDNDNDPVMLARDIEWAKYLLDNSYIYNYIYPIHINEGGETNFEIKE